MTWSFDSNSAPRDTSIPIEEEFARFASPKTIPWRYQVRRLCRFVIGYHPRQRRRQER
jgi:hypothetical protein